MLRPLLLFTTLFAVCVDLDAQTSGAIYTTNRNATQVNGNIYNQQRDVYLTAGPGLNAPCSGPGLVDGHYYFQVTDPSGQILLSTDGIAQREVVVLGGVLQSHVTGSHRTYAGNCGSVVVQLIPFNASPNGSGEYKVWLTPVSRYDPLLSGFNGFAARYSKTDNFKVRTGGGQPVSQCQISGYKFYDHSEDAIWNPGVDPLEVAIPGWRIEIYKNAVLNGVTFTDESGRYEFLRDMDGSVYTITEKAPGGFVGDGIPGAVWVATTPRSGSVTANASSVAGPSFGNLSFEVKPGLGRTKGFWHNQNGRDQLLLTDPRWREVLTNQFGVPLCLRRNVVTSNPAESIFVPLQLPVAFGTAHDDFASWIVGDPAHGHAGFILSTQVAAAVLNQSCGFMQFTTYVDVHNDGLLVSFVWLVQHASEMLCNPLCGETGPHATGAALELREHILMCINEFGGINNSGDLNEPQVVYGSSEEPDNFSSPYGGV